MWLQGGPIVSTCTLLGLIALKGTLFIVNLKQLSAWIIPQKAFHLFLTLRELFQDVDIKIYNILKKRKRKELRLIHLLRFLEFGHRLQLQQKHSSFILLHTWVWNFSLKLRSCPDGFEMGWFHSFLLLVNFEALTEASNSIMIFVSVKTYWIKYTE